MSNLYPDLNHTNYPDKIDHYEDMIDVDLVLKPVVDEYYRLYQANDMQGMTNLINSNPRLMLALFNADKYNKLKDTLEAQGRLYKSDIQQYIMTVVHNRGSWNNITKYRQYDLVSYPVQGAEQWFVAIPIDGKYDIPIGTLPTNTDYFVPQTMRGEQGASGVGLSFKKNYDPLIPYNKDDCVTYNNILWAATKPSLNQTPSDISQYWTKAMELPKQIITSSEQPQDQVTGDVWLEIIS